MKLSFDFEIGVALVDVSGLRPDELEFVLREKLIFKHKNGYFVNEDDLGHLMFTLYANQLISINVEQE